MFGSKKVQRLTITAHELIDCGDGSKIKDKEFTVQVNPQSIKYKFGINTPESNGNSNDNNTIQDISGGSGALSGFKGYNKMTMNFSFVADATGILPIDDDMKKLFLDGTKPTIKPYLQLLQETVYGYVEEAHRPAYLRLTWGNVFPSSSTKDSGTAPVFKGTLKDCEIEIVLFSLEGEPIKAKINLNIESAMAADERPLGKSPDLTHYVDINHGDKMTKHCNKIYGRFDTHVCSAVAEYNNMIDWNLQPVVGKKLIFPSIHLLNELYLEEWEKLEEEERKKKAKTIETHYDRRVRYFGKKRANQFFKRSDYNPNESFEEWNNRRNNRQNFA